jgi:hypothetical protein
MPAAEFEHTFFAPSDPATVDKAGTDRTADAA